MTQIDDRRPVSPWLVYGGAVLGLLALAAIATWLFWPRSSTPKLGATAALYQLEVLTDPLAFDDVPDGATAGADGVRAVCSPPADANPPTAWVEYDVGEAASDPPVDDLLARFDAADWRTTDNEVADGVRVVRFEPSGDIVATATLTVEEDRLAVSVSLDYEDACYG